MGETRQAGWIGVLGGPSLWLQAPTGLYVEELFAQAGLLNWRWLGSTDELADESVRLVVVPNGRMLDEAAAAALGRFVQAGGRLLVLGRPGPLAALFNVRPQPPVREGWLIRSPAAAGRLAGVCPIPLHAFDLVHLLPGEPGRPRPGPRCSPLHFSIGNHHVNWPVSARVTVGRGEALLIAADLAGSVVRIQQGLAIHHDGQPAPDGSAPIDDGILKCDDSIMLDWTRDRQRPLPERPPIFLQPQGDLIRELLIASVLELADSAWLAVPLLAAWPRRLPAVGLISHDSDGHGVDEALRELDTDAECDIASTWCCMAGTDDGQVSEYSPDMLARVAASGHEIAFHYDAQTAHDLCRWGHDTFTAQLARLRSRMRSAGIDAAIYSNKNHYTRWQGRLECFRWLAGEGIRVDQTKGPSKTGELGWPFGTCHPWRPIDDETQPPRLLDLLEISLATQDPGLEKYPAEFVHHYVDVAVEHGGVAHLLFHPAHTHREEVRTRQVEAVAYGRGKGLEWWTSRQIGHWQFARRAARLKSWRIDGDRAVLQLDAPQPLEGASVTLACAAGGAAAPAKLSGLSEAVIPL